MRRCLVVVMLSLAIVGCSSDSDSTYTEDDIEYRLSALAGAGTSDEAVREYGQALDAATAVCQEDRDLIGDMAYAAWKQADEGGADTTTLELLRALPDSVPAELAPTKCADILSLLVVMML